MIRKLWQAALVCALFVSVAGRGPGADVSAQSGELSPEGAFTQTVLTPVWGTGIMTDVDGQAGVLVHDLDGDGLNEIAACGGGHLFVLNHQAPGRYEHQYYSPYLGCHRLTAADRDHDGRAELIMIDPWGRVSIFDGASFQRLADFDLPGVTFANDLLAADVDSDGDLEIALVTDDDLWVYHAGTLALEWRAQWMGGAQIAAGDLDGDGGLEMVVSGHYRRIIDAAARVQEWAATGGFGVSWTLGDVDGDARDEIVYSTPGGLWVVEGETQSTRLLTAGYQNACDLAVSDLDADGAGEVLAADNCLGQRLAALRGSDGAVLWIFEDEGIGLSGISVGDADQDGRPEVLWTATEPEGEEASRLVIADPASQGVEWRSLLDFGRLHAAAGDLEGDGRAEIVVAARQAKVSAPASLVVYDGADRTFRWAGEGSASACGVSFLEIAQLDADAALEILTVCTQPGSTFLSAVDGATRAVQWTSAPFGTGQGTALVTGSLDADAAGEIIVGSEDRRVVVLDGASDHVIWESAPLDAPLLDLALGDLDGDDLADLAVLTDASVYVFEAGVSEGETPQAGAWRERLHLPLEYGAQVAIRPSAGGRGGQLVTAEGYPFYDSFQQVTLQAWDGATFTPGWQYVFGDATLDDLLAADLDRDGVWELILLGQEDVLFTGTSLLCIGAPENATFCEYRNANRWGNIHHLSLADLDQDGQEEALWSSDRLVQVNEITSRSSPEYRLYFPLVGNAPHGLYGWVTENGIPAVGVEIELGHYSKDLWVKDRTTLTDEDGKYYFPAPVEPDYHPIHVCYVNPKTGDTHRLARWCTESYSSYARKDHIGDFDLANVELRKPVDGKWLALPAKFEWQARPNSPDDQYTLRLFDPAIYYLNYFQSVGANTHYLLTYMPSSFYPDRLLAWEVWIRSPDGGHGISYETRDVAFTNWGNPPH